jgi:hypothetical protein
MARRVPGPGHRGPEHGLADDFGEPAGKGGGAVVAQRPPGSPRVDPAALRRIRSAHAQRRPVCRRTTGRSRQSPDGPGRRSR